MTAARRALKERQLAALRGWLGDDHELLRPRPAQPPPAPRSPAEADAPAPPRESA